MKKTLISVTGCFILLLSCVFTSPTQVMAASPSDKSQIVSDYIESLEGGSYFRVTITEATPTVTAPLVSRSTWSSRSVQTKSGSKSIAYYNSDNELAWEFTLHGTFQYIPGSSAACTSASYSISIYDSNWLNSYASSTTNGNQAIGDATFKRKVLFVTTNMEDVHLTLSCNAYGTLY